MAVMSLATPSSVTRNVPVLFAPGPRPPCWACAWGWTDTGGGRWRRCWPAAACRVHGDPDAGAPALELEELEP